MNHSDTFVTVTFLGEEELAELDLQLRDDFVSPGAPEDTDLCMLPPDESRQKGETNPGPLHGDFVKISEVISILSKRRDAGATHVSMDSHYDHHGYEFAFYRIVPASVEAKSSAIERAEKIIALKKQIDSLDKDRDNQRKELYDEMRKLQKS